jgi:hypothetical protein
MGEPIPMSRIQVRTSFVGVHFWKDAPDEVAFLRNLHRHVFKVSAMCEVAHHDRELEFFMVRQRIDTFIKGTFNTYHTNMPDILYLGPASCEMLATMVQTMLADVYQRPFSVIVREDDENAGIV